GQRRGGHQRGRRLDPHEPDHDRGGRHDVARRRDATVPVGYQLGGRRRDHDRRGRRGHGRGGARGDDHRAADMRRFIINPYAFGTGGGGGGPSLPVAGALLWVHTQAGLFEDNAASDVAEVNDSVAVWADQSGQGNHLTQTTGVFRPVLVSAEQHRS